MKFKKVDIDKVKRNPNQPRKEFDEQSIQELANSIKKDGLFQPILVRKKEGFYEIVQGERRYRACKMLSFTEMPVMIQELNDEDAFHLAVVENIQREQMTAIEEAEAFKKYIELGYTQEQIANKVSKSRSYVLNRLQLLELSPNIIRMIENNQLSSSHIKPLNKLKNTVAKLINHDKGFQMLQEEFYNEHKHEEKISVKVLNDWTDQLREILLSSIVAAFNGHGDKVISYIEIDDVAFPKTFKNLCKIYDLHISSLERKDIHFLLDRALIENDKLKKSEIYRIYEDLEKHIFDKNLDLERVWSQRGMDKKSLSEQTLEEITESIKEHRNTLQEVVESRGYNLNDLERDLGIIYNV